MITRFIVVVLKWYLEHFIRTLSINPYLSLIPRVHMRHLHIWTHEIFSFNKYLMTEKGFINSKTKAVDDNMALVP